MPEGSLAVTGKYTATHVVSRRIASLRVVGGSPISVSMGSILRVTSTGPGRHAAELPDGRTGWIAAGSVAGLAEWERKPPSVPELLRRLMGTPYVWGGKSAFGFDCSGLVQFVMGLTGVALPRDSGDQAGRGRLIRGLSRLHPLDLVFFGSDSHIDHVAIHLGDLKIAHASGWVRVESLDRSSPGFRGDLLERFRFARRIAGVQG
jgi:cell wall-associated NlpC family hydrolase